VWFYHSVWYAGALAPRAGEMLTGAPGGGRTTAWCPTCQ
jgi:hypothetical protein